jgi:protein involved in polysaccharide export with SLBB domain
LPRCTFLLALLAAMLGSHRLQAQASTGSDTGSAVLSPGDRIRIAVWRDSALSGEFAIAPDGSIIHPLYRSVSVTGIPMDEVERRLRTFLSRFTVEPAFVATPLVRIIVGGEVRQPNVYTVPWGTTVTQAIALAGGPTDRGRMERVQVHRRNGTQILDLTEPTAQAGRAQVRSGDQIVIGRNRDVMRDIVAPSSSIVAALASIITIFVQLQR